MATIENRTELTTRLFDAGCRDMRRDFTSNTAQHCIKQEDLYSESLPANKNNFILPVSRIWQPKKNISVESLAIIAGEGLIIAGVILLSPALLLLAAAGCGDGMGESVCGNGIMESDEWCDKGDLGAENCSQIQAGAAGAITCTDGCMLDLSQCQFRTENPLPPQGDAPQEDENPTPESPEAGGNIAGDINWVNATTLSGKQKDNATASGKISVTRGADIYRCNATIISPSMIITNQHCVSDSDSAHSTRFYPTTESSVPIEQQMLDSFSCGVLLATDCAHDAAILDCLPHPATGMLPGEAYGMAELELEREFTEGEEIYQIHTNCDQRNGSCEPVKLLSPGKVLSYGDECITLAGDEECGNCKSESPQAREDADSLPGSSGGGIFDAETNRLIGLFWGAPAAVTQVDNYNFASSLAHLVRTNAIFAGLMEPLLPCEDGDNDGFGTNVSARCIQAGADCDDADLNINPSAAEICDGADNNCDGDTDENISRECGTETGECQKGIETCAGGEWGSECEGEVKPVPELCDNLDNDCDGAIDEQLSRPCGISEGECREGTQTCLSGQWGECEGTIGPAPEDCDGNDNDCDGLTDNGVDPFSAALCSGDGICASTVALSSCDGGLWQCSYPQEYVDNECPVTSPHCGTGSLEDPTCNNELDDDCDGVTDENNPFTECEQLPDYWTKVVRGVECYSGYAGVCATHGGTYKCVQLAEGCGVSVDCVGAQYPENERCGDGIDSDCDGFADNRNDLDDDGWGDCPGRMDCNENNPDIHPGAAEVCDNIDNNCDGQTDEGVKNACGSCGPVPVEVCDNRDNDCDGQIDEALIRQCGQSNVGECRIGIETCVRGNWQDCTATGPDDNYCDGRDHTCDGVPETECWYPPVGCHPKCIAGYCVTEIRPTCK